MSGKSKVKSQKSKVARVALLAAMALTIPARAATTIAETRVMGPDGRLATGTITITATAAFATPAGARVETKPAVAAIVNGAFRVSLAPNDSGFPSGTSYVAKWEIDGAAPRTEFWVVPTSASVLNVAAVAGNRVVPSVAVQVTQLAALVTVDGSYCLAVAGGRVTGLVACSGGGSTIGDPRGKTWAQLTFATWSQLGQYTWSQMQ